MIAFHALLFGSAAVVAATLVKPAAQQVSRSGSFELPCHPDTAFPFFSPEGEREWVKGWNPTPVFPDTIEFRRDTIFRERPPDDEAVWTIVDVDYETHRAEYVRVAPSHAARIVVRIEAQTEAQTEALGSERSKVTVTYTITAFGKSPANLIAAFSEETYAAKMRAWQEQISACLRNR